MNNFKSTLTAESSYGSLLKKIKDKKIVTTVVGLGYVGWSLVEVMLKNELAVNGYDINPDKIESIQSSENYLGNFDYNDVRHLLNKGQLRLSSNPEILSSSDIVIICVPTPLNTDGITPDLSFIQQASIDIASYCSKNTLIIIESTVYPQFTQKYFAPLLEKFNFLVGDNIFLSFSSERVNPGSNYSVDSIPKIVSGYTKNCLNLASEFYKIFMSDVIRVKSPVIAEMSKLLENSYRYINIAFINEFATQCKELDVNVWDVLDAAMTKPYGYQRFDPGPGVGGHCIPIDPLYLKWSLNKVGVTSKFIDTAKEVNDIMPKWIVQKLKSDYYNCSNKILKNVLVLGVTYKKNVDDLRESTAFNIFKELDNSNIEVMFSDPYFPIIEINGSIMQSVELNATNIKKFDAVILHTAHSQFNYETILNHAKYIYDLRGKYNGNNSSKILKLSL